MRAVYAIFARSISRLYLHFNHKKVLHQPALYEMMAVLAEVKRLGLSRLGRKMRPRWRAQYSAYKRLVERLTECIQTKATFISGGERIDAENCPKIVDDTTIILSLSCKRWPLAEARVTSHVKGGMTGLPARMESDSKGQIKVSMGQVFGKGKVKVGFTHYLKDVDGANYLGVFEPSHRSTVCFRSTQPARMSAKITGVKGAFKRQVYEGLRSFVAQKWGAKLVSGYAPLTAAVRVQFGNVSEAMGSYAVPLEISIVVNSKEGPLFEKKKRVGSVGDTKAKAKKQALNNLLRAIQRW